MANQNFSRRTLNDFSVRSLSKNAAFQAGNSRTQQRENLGSLRRASLFDEVNKDEPDTYEFRLKRRTTLKVELKNQEDLGFFDLFGTKKRVQAILFDSDRDQLRSTDRIVPEDEDDFRIRLNAGTYFVRVTGRSENDLEYRLRLRTGEADDFDDDDSDDD